MIVGAEATVSTGIGDGPTVGRSGPTAAVGEATGEDSAPAGVYCCMDCAFPQASIVIARPNVIVKDSTNFKVATLHVAAVCVPRVLSCEL